MSQFIFLFISLSMTASAAPLPVPKDCVAVVKACRAGGFVPGQFDKHKGEGLWAGCVRPLSKGRAVSGVKGVSKNVALTCLKARHSIRNGKG